MQYSLATKLFFQSQIFFGFNPQDLIKAVKNKSINSCGDLSSASLISVADIEARNLYCFSLRMLFLLRLKVTCLLIGDPETLLMTLRKFMERYCDGDERSPASFATRAYADTFHRIGKQSAATNL